MEFWEKEYERIIKEDNEADRRRKRQEYYDACWSEIEKPKGKHDVFPKRNHFLVRLWELLKKTGVFLLAFMFLGVSSCGVQSGRTSRILTNTFSNFFEGRILGNTYINGVGFQNMMTFLEDWQECYMELLNACANNSLFLEEQEIYACNEKIKEFEQGFTSLKYHKSYAELIEVNLQVLSLCKELLSEIQNNENFEVKEDTYSCISKTLQLEREVLIKCFDRNGIPYHENDEKINYTFKIY